MKALLEMGYNVEMTDLMPIKLPRSAGISNQ
jgi:hypothetical protein